MAIRDLVPWNRNREKMDIINRESDPFLALRDDVNRAFDQFFNDPFSLAPWRIFDERVRGYSPRVDVAETDKEITVTAEVPGMDQENIHVSLMDNVLTISGRKESEKEEKSKQYHRVERSFGSFQRSISLPAEVDEDHVDAVFKKGVLTITLPKRDVPAKGKRITVKPG